MQREYFTQGKFKLRLLLLLIISMIGCVYIPVHYRYFSSGIQQFDEWYCEPEISGGVFFKKSEYNNFNDMFNLEIYLYSAADLESDNIFIYDIKIISDKQEILKEYSDKYLTDTRLYPPYRLRSFNTIKSLDIDTYDIFINRNINKLTLSFGLKIKRPNGNQIIKDCEYFFVRNDETKWEWRLIGC